MMSCHDCLNKEIDIDFKNDEIERLTAEVEQLNRRRKRLYEVARKCRQDNQRFRDAGVKLVKAARFTMGQGFGSGAMLTALCRLSEACYAFEKGDVDND